MTNFLTHRLTPPCITPSFISRGRIPGHRLHQQPSDVLHHQRRCNIISMVYISMFSTHRTLTRVHF